MPTGYTAPIYEGEDIGFEQFVLSCARAMGGAVMLREADGSVLPTEENVVDTSTYHAEHLLAAEGRLDELANMTAAEASDAAEEEFEQQQKAFRLAQGDSYGLRRRYEHMREQVGAWEPPSEEHVGLKDFMLQQLSESIKFDCHEPTPPEALSSVGWLKKEIEKAERDVRYHREAAAKQAERNASRVWWISELRGSLEQVPA